MEKINQTFYYIKIIFIGVFVTVVSVFVYKFLKFREQKIVFYPKFNIINTKYTDNLPDQNVLTSAIRGAVEATKRIKEMREKKKSEKTKIHLKV